MRVMNISRGWSSRKEGSTDATTEKETRRPGGFPVLAALILGGVSLLTVVACQAEGHADGRGVLHTPLGDVHLGVEATLTQPGHYDMNNETGLCMELDFFDVNGRKLGSATITPGPNSGICRACA
jgi:hypothetical protein